MRRVWPHLLAAAASLPTADALLSTAAFATTRGHTPCPSSPLVLATRRWSTTAKASSATAADADAAAAAAAAAATPAVAEAAVTSSWTRRPLPSPVQVGSLFGSQSVCTEVIDVRSPSEFAEDHVPGQWDCGRPAPRTSPLACPAPITTNSSVCSCNSLG